MTSTALETTITNDAETSTAQHLINGQWLGEADTSG